MVSVSFISKIGQKLAFNHVFHAHASGSEVRPRNTILVRRGFEKANSQIERIDVDYETAKLLQTDLGRK